MTATKEADHSQRKESEGTNTALRIDIAIPNLSLSLAVTRKSSWTAQTTVPYFELATAVLTLGDGMGTGMWSR